MNADRLLAHYHRISDAPDAIARLRRFVLDLAVRGKLSESTDVEWNSTPIEGCLEALPDGRFLHQGWSPQCEDYPSPNDKIWGVLKTTAIQDGFFQEDQNKKLPEKLESKPLLEVRPGDLLITCAGPRARCGIACLVRNTRKRLLISGKMYRFRANASIVLPEYLLLYLRSYEAQAAINAMKTGSSESGLNLTQDRFRTFQVRFGPVSEQHRIVAKVDELMALCDRLEAARKAREAARDRLAAASLARLNAPDPDSFQHDTRFALNALPALTTRRDQIKQLRQTILNLAVRGKLVPQNPKDEPANIPTSPEIGNPAGLPAGWRYTRLAALLAEDTRNGYSRRPDDAPDGTPILRISAGTIRHDGIVAEEEHKLISGISAEDREQFGMKAGDLLACRFNGNKAFVGRLTIFKDYLSIGPIYPDKLIRVRVAPELVLATYLRLAGETDIVRAEVEAACATTVGNWGISGTNLKQIRFPLPPLAEQHRIVAKVDELMALCDRLEASLATADDTRRRLLDALLAEALAVNADRDLEAAE